MVLVVKEQLRHVKGVGYQSFVHACATQSVVSKLLEGVFHQVELGQRAGDGGARILAQATVRVLNAGDIVVGIGDM